MAEARNLKGELSSDVSIEDIRSCWKVPAIAHFCSLFRSTFLLPDFEIEELEEALFLDAGVEQSDFITNLVVQLLRGIRGLKRITSEDYLECLRCVMKEKWEIGEKRVNPLNSQDVTFKMLPTLTKVEILHALCDYRLDAADVTVLKDYDGDNLRVEPLGTDREGATYWYFYGTRLYKEDRQLTQEEKTAKHKQKLKEKRKRKKEYLKTIRNMKETRRKQKQKVKKGKNKGSERKKKKKSSKLSDDESNNELVNEEGLQIPLNNSNKQNAKKGQRRKNAKSVMKAVSSSKPSKATKSKKGLATEYQSKEKHEEETTKTSSRRQNTKKTSKEKKQDTHEENVSNKYTTAVPKKKKAPRAETQQSTKNSTTKQNTTKKVSSSPCAEGGNTTNKGTPSQESACKSRKRKVIKSKAIISESEVDSDDDQPLKKLAKGQKSKKDVNSKANKQKSYKSNTVCEMKKTKASNSKSKDHVKRSNTQKPNDKKGKRKRLPTNTRKTQELSPLSSEDDLSSVISDTDSDSEDDMEPPRWHLVCHSQEDWQKLTDFFKKSKVKCEKELYRTLANDFLPEIHSLFAAKERALRKRLQELAPRRASSRVVIMQLKREEEERLKSIQEAEQSSRRQQVEEEKREMGLRSKSQQHSNENEHRVDDKSLKTTQGTVGNSRGGCKKAKKMKTENDSIHTRLQQVYDAVSNHEDSWPFVDPVDEAYAPAYYQIIIKPMCLNIIQKKIKKKDYNTKDEFERDMNLLFTNCLEYNGPGNEYTLMAENLKSCLEYNMEQIFPKEEVDNAENDSDGASSVSDHYVHQRPPQRQSAKNANTRLEKLEDRVYARLRGLSSSESSIIESQDSSRVVSDEEEMSEVKMDNGNITSDDQDELGNREGVNNAQEGENEDKGINLKHYPLMSTDPVPSTSGCNIQDTTNNTCSSKSTVMDISEIDNQIYVQASDQMCFKPVIAPAVKDTTNTSVFKPSSVIAFAPGSTSEELSSDTHKNVYKKEQNQRCSDTKQESVQGSVDIAVAHTSQFECKELHGLNLNTNLPGSHASKVNRVKPIQNVRPYIPDSHTEEDADMVQSVPCDVHDATQQISQGRPAMIDLNSKRLEVLKPMKSSSSGTHAPCHKVNSFIVNLGLNQAAPQGNLYTPSSLSDDSQDSKQSSHSGTKTKPLHTKTKSNSPPELPAPLTVLPVQESIAQNVPAVQPLLPSHSSLQVSHWHQDQLANSSANTFQHYGLVAPPASERSEQNIAYEPTQKLWHPLGFEDKCIADHARADNLTSNRHTVLKPDQSYLDHRKLSQASLGQPVQVHSQGGNILQSLLHKQPNASEDQQSSYISKNPDGESESTKMCIESGKQDDILTEDRNILCSNVARSNLSSTEGILCREATGQCQTDKEKQHCRSVKPVYNETNLPSQQEMGLKTCMPWAYNPSPQRTVQLHHQQVEATQTNSFQSVVRHPENAILNMDMFDAKRQKLSSTSHYPHSSSIQSNVTSQVDYGKDSMSQVHIGQAERARGIETMTHARQPSSYISTLTTDSRSMQEHKDALDVRGYARPQTPYNQAHASLYTDQLRMHASQASGAYAYSSGSHLSHLLPTRQTSGGQSSSAFSPPDPFSSHSAFRMQRPSLTIFPQYIGQQEAEHFARQQYQQHMHHRAGVGTGLTAYQPQSSHMHPDMAYYNQHGVGSTLLGHQPVRGVGTPMPYDPSLLLHPSHMPGYK